MQIAKYDPQIKDENPLEFFEITTIDNVTMEGWIVKPKNLEPEKKYPVLFYFYSEPAGQDNKWEIPHFEKMLYDNGLILELLSNIYSITKDKKYQLIINDTFEWIVNDMTRVTKHYTNFLS